MTIPIRNLTRLNTDDLQAVVNAVQTAISNWNGTPSLPRTKEFEFVIYGGSGVEKCRTWNPSSQRYAMTTSKKYIGRSVWSRFEQISVLPPDRMFDSPLELLSMSETDTPRIPHAALVALASAIAQRFDRSYRQGKEFNIEQHIEGLSVRIEGAVASRRSADDARNLRLGKARARVNNAGYYGRKSMNELLRAIELIRGAKSHLIRADKGLEAPHVQGLQAAAEQLAMAIDLHLSGFEEQLRQLSGETVVQGGN